MNNDLISRSEAERLGATCLARRNENGQLEAIISLDNAPTVEADDERPQGEWIPVSERLPDDREDTYWVCTDGEYQCQCRWTNVNPIWTNLKTDWHWCIFDILQYQKVIAWQPLPEPYKEGGAE